MVIIGPLDYDPQDLRGYEQPEENNRHDLYWNNINIVKDDFIENILEHQKTYPNISVNNYIRSNRVAVIVINIATRKTIIPRW